MRSTSTLTSVANLVQNILVILIFTLCAKAQEVANMPVSSGERDSEGLPLWEIGAGVGYSQFEHYPASKESTFLTLPFPTFQYRGKFLRANDADGARAYLLKDSKWSLDFSGNAHAGQSFADDSARAGMNELPWVLELGPQLSYEFNSEWEAQFAAFQAVSSDTKLTKQSGQTLNARLKYTWSFPFSIFDYKINGAGNLSLGLNAGTQDFMATYFEVPVKYATSARPSYSAVGGLLSNEISVFQSLKSADSSLYLGLSLVNYEYSVNRNSPLHKSDHNVSFWIGFTRTLQVSSQKALSEEDTEGLINRYYEKRK